MVSLILPPVSEKLKDCHREGAYTVEVATSSLPLGIPITTVGDLSECVLDVVIEGRRVLDINFISSPVRVGAGRMSDLSSTSDDQRSSTGRILQRDNTINSTRKNPRI